MRMRIILSWALTAFLIWFIIRQPEQAAHLARNIGSFLSAAAAGIAQFTAHL